MPIACSTWHGIRDRCQAVRKEQKLGRKLERCKEAGAPSLSFFLPFFLPLVPFILFVLAFAVGMLDNKSSAFGDHWSGRDVLFVRLEHVGCRLTSSGVVVDALHELICDILTIPGMLRTAVADEVIREVPLFHSFSYYFRIRMRGRRRTSDGFLAVLCIRGRPGSRRRS